jgi:alpha-tubulin suppressor-like RCC1 family protein
LATSQTGFTAISAGFKHSLALINGVIWAFGDNTFGQLGDGTNVERDVPTSLSTITNVKAVSTRYRHSLALKTDGSVYAWGDNSAYQLGNGLAINSNSPVQVTSLTSGVAAIAAGTSHSLALKSDGTVWAWGNNTYGQLGDGTNTTRATPVQVAGLTNVTAIAAGNNHCMALKVDGTIWTWGDNVWGQLGDGTTIQKTSPVQVAIATGAAGFALGGVSSYVATASNIFAWGGNAFGQLGDGTLIGKSSPVKIY